MGSLNSIDYGVIVFYLGFLIAMGFYLKNKASQIPRCFTVHLPIIDFVF